MTFALTPLVWTHIDYAHAVCPITGTTFSVHHEEGRYWGSWPNALPAGRATLEEVKADAEAWRAAKVLPHVVQDEVGVQDAAQVLMTWSGERRWGVAAARKTFEDVLKRAIKS